MAFARMVSSFITLKPDVKVFLILKHISRYLTDCGIAAEMEMTCGDLFTDLGFCILLGELSDSSLHRA